MSLHLKPHCNMQALLIGQRAAGLLASSDYSGSVLAVVSHAIYLLGDDGEILWLARTGTPAHRRCIMITCQPDGPKPEMRFVIAAGGVISIGKVVTVDLVNAERWIPLTVKPGLLQPLHVVVDGSRRAMLAIWCLPMPQGLAHTLRSITSPHPSAAASEDSTMKTNLNKLAMPAIQELIAACYAGDTARILRAGLALVGLGSGLTPSGDDYLGGLLFTAHQLHAAFPAMFTWEKGHIQDFLNAAQPLTNRISHTILSDLANGYGPAPLHDLINALLQDGTEQDVLGSVDRLTRVGQTSGWDMLAGAMTGLMLIEAAAS